MARGSKTFTNFCHPSATLIRLYEFLKNSRCGAGVSSAAFDLVDTDQHASSLHQAACMLRHVWFGGG